MRYALLLLATLGLSACHSWQQHAEAPQPIDRYDQVTRYRAIDIDGNIDATLLVGRNKHDVRVKGKGPRVADVSCTVRGGTLYIKDNNSGAGRVRVTIHAKRIDRIHVNGESSVTAKRFNTPRLVINSTTDGRIDLRGHIGLRQIHDSGNGLVLVQGIDSKRLDITASGMSHIRLRGYAGVEKIRASDRANVNLYWVDGEKVDVAMTGHSRLRLAGTTESLYAKVHGKAYLNTRYLRAKQAFVRTDGSARADLQALDSLNVIASGASTIRYFKQPKYLSEHMLAGGAIL